ncbi:MAG: hypothetical protein IT270_06880 [Saprospiraceae bacterium]|nr:hypothetical protein [Saprospiraceae bacterium]
MPIKVNEIVIKATVVDTRKGQANQDANTAQGTLSDDDKKNLVTECVEQVMEILQRKNER